MYIQVSKSDINQTLTTNENNDFVLNLEVSVSINKNLFLGSLNPTYLSPSNINDAIYYTTVGFYDDKSNLVAVGKVVEPINTNEEITLEFETEYIVIKFPEYDRCDEDGNLIEED